jgi:hypothetical protein
MRHRQTCWNVDLRSYQITPQKNLHIWICSPMNGGQYNDVLANDTYLVAVVKKLTTWYLAGGSLGLICINPILSYNFFSKLSFKILVFKGRNNAKYYIVASYVALGKTQQSWNNINHHPSEWMPWAPNLGVSSQFLIIQKWWWDSFINSTSRDSNCP